MILYKMAMSFSVGPGRSKNYKKGEDVRVERYEQEGSEKVQEGNERPCKHGTLDRCVRC